MIGLQEGERTTMENLRLVGFLDERMKKKQKFLLSEHANMLGGTGRRVWLGPAYLTQLCVILGLTRTERTLMEKRGCLISLMPDVA
jgi:hypothetical protein